LVNDTDLAWLSAVIEAEGSISAQATTRKKDGYLVLTPIIRIANNDNGINDEMLRICNELNVKATAFVKKNGTTTTRIDGMLSVDLLLVHIQKYLRSSKVNNAEAMRKFIQLRRNKSPGKFRLNKFNREELELICSIRTHSSAKTLDEMMQYPNVDIDD